jgi:hypothetical protein
MKFAMKLKARWRRSALTSSFFQRECDDFFSSVLAKARARTSSQPKCQEQNNRLEAMCQATLRAPRGKHRALVGAPVVILEVCRCRGSGRRKALKSEDEDIHWPLGDIEAAHRIRDICARQSGRDGTQALIAFRLLQAGSGSSAKIGRVIGEITMLVRILRRNPASGCVMKFFMYRYKILYTIFLTVSTLYEVILEIYHNNLAFLAFLSFRIKRQKSLPLFPKTLDIGVRWVCRRQDL